MTVCERLIMPRPALTAPNGNSNLQMILHQLSLLNNAAVVDNATADIINGGQPGGFAAGPLGNVNGLRRVGVPSLCCWQPRQLAEYDACQVAR